MLVATINSVNWLRRTNPLFAALHISLLCCLVFFTTLKSLNANASDSNEFHVKAAYLYHFTRLVKWPTPVFGSFDPTFQLCVLGSNPFDGKLKPMSQRRTHGGLPITLSYPKSTEAVRGCHLLYIATSDTKREADILDQYKDTPLLTISSHPGFISRGGVIGFITIGKRVRLEINRAAAQQANIELSAKLLEVAISIKDKSSRTKK